MGKLFFGKLVELLEERIAPPSILNISECFPRSLGG